MMAELTSRGLERDVYLWSDDNLSTDYLWRHLSLADIDRMVDYRNYGRVGCFKGFDALSFSFNTRAESGLFDRQFELMDRLIGLGLDVYAYATFTTPARPESAIRSEMVRFLDRLQQIDDNLPLRTMPLEVTVFTPVQSRMHRQEKAAIANQYIAISTWEEEMARRYTDVQRARNVADVPMRGGR